MRRRTFVGTLAAVAVAPAPWARAASQAFRARLETFTDWLNAPPDVRDRAWRDLAGAIRAADEPIHAWVQILPQTPTGSGPLDGIPFGVKDIIETKGLATEYGSPIYKGRVATADAAIVAELRRRGGVEMGKTHLAAFAYATPPPTRNPRNLEHTPGGSSSGSAAAVAAGMVPFALGTQTGGSVLRPASFCGVTGFKPTYGRLPMDGVLPLATSLDTLGLFTHTPADMLALWRAMGCETGSAEEIAFGFVDPVPEVDSPMASAYQRTIGALRAGGMTIRSVDIAAMLAKLVTASRTVMFYEGARFHADRYKRYGDRLQDLANLVRQGLQIPDSTYDAARREIADGRGRVLEAYQSAPVVLVPAAPGPAPLGLQSTGDSRMNAPWTAMGVPAISIPMPVGDALPLGLQLTAAHDHEARLLQAAIRIHRLLHGLPASVSRPPAY